ncbi:TPA: ATP-binding cassette domain-containing protein [Streptococcus suis]|nr:ATP-binding cassette domain-containing protein [Streptococcus suis]
MNFFQLQSVGLSDRDMSILTDISFTVLEGERLTLVGPSGSGKSSIFKLLAGLISMTSLGKIKFGSNYQIGFTGYFARFYQDRYVAYY